MNRDSIESSTIASAGYDPAALTLEIEFKNGRIYQYYDVPQQTYDEFAGSASKGTYLNNVIKKQFRCAKL